MTGGSCIRPFAAGDLPRLQEIREAAFAPVFASFRQIVGAEISAIAFAAIEQEQAALLDKICTDSPAHQVFVAECNGEIAGFVSIALDQNSGLGEIDLNAVHPRYQRQGIGGRLFAFALAHMKDAGMKAATVGTGGDASHEPARRAYQKAGFSAAILSLYFYKSLRD